MYLPRTELTPINLLSRGGVSQRSPQPCSTASGTTPVPLPYVERSGNALSAPGPHLESVPFQPDCCPCKDSRVAARNHSEMSFSSTGQSILTGRESLRGSEPLTGWGWGAYAEAADPIGRGCGVGRLEPMPLENRTSLSWVGSALSVPKPPFLMLPSCRPLLSLTPRPLTSLPLPRVSPVPQVLRSCADFVEEHGVVDGIYRLSGVSSNIQKLR